MGKAPYESASSIVDSTEDVVLFSNDGADAYFDPWGLVQKLEL